MNAAIPSRRAKDIAKPTALLNPERTCYNCREAGYQDYLSATDERDSTWTDFGGSHWRIELSALVLPLTADAWLTELNDLGPLRGVSLAVIVSLSLILPLPTNPWWTRARERRNYLRSVWVVQSIAAVGGLWVIATPVHPEYAPSPRSSRVWRICPSSAGRCDRLGLPGPESKAGSRKRVTESTVFGIPFGSGQPGHGTA